MKHPNKSHPGKAGRKPIPIDWNLVSQLCHIQCTGPEISAVTNIDEDTFTNRCKTDNGCEFSEYIKKHSQNGKASLRRAQWKKAIGQPAQYDDDGNKIVDEVRPDTAMQIFLGKNMLGQTDRQEVDHSGTVNVISEWLRNEPAAKKASD
jgi:hypothetical protein